MDDDFLLVYKMRRGNEMAMDEFVRKYYAAILKYCKYRISNMNDVEDAVQETFLHFFRALPNYKHCGKAMNFLYRIAGNICKDYYKKSIELTLLDDLEPEEGHVNRINDKIDLGRALHKLSVEFQEVIILYYFQDIKMKEIADILDIGIPLVKYRMKKAKEQLKEALGKEEWG